MSHDQCPSQRPSRALTLLVTWGGAGWLHPAPGTWGTLAAAPPGWAIALYGGPGTLLAAAALLCGVGIWSSGRYAAQTGRTDPQEVVIDEAAGVWLALACAPLTVIGVGAAIALFRVFDIVKPFPASWLERRLPGGYGIMLDDMMAGAYAGAALLALRDAGTVADMVTGG